MSEKNINQEFRLQKIEEIRTYLLRKINQNELMSKKHKNVCPVLNYIEHLLILISTVTGWVSISVFAFLAGIPIGITSSAIVLKNCTITAGIIKKMKKNDKIVLLAKSQFNSLEAFISKALLDSNISHD